MIRILRLFKRHLVALMAVVALLVVQANAELSLPTYMSQIVDVGIQQQGVASPVPTTIRAESLSDLTLFMSADDAQLVEGAYGPADADGIRTYQGSSEDQADGSELASVMSLPEVAVLALGQGVDGSTLGMPEGTTLDLGTVRAAVAAGALSQDQLADAAQQMGDAMGAMSGSIVSQRAVSYVAQEYEAQGINLTDIQNGYLASTAATMFALCLVGLVCAVIVGLIASRTGATISKELRHDAFAKVMRFSPAEVNKFSQASLITRCTNDIQQIQMVVIMVMRLVLLAPIMGCVAVLRVINTHTGLEWTIAVALIAVCATVGILAGLAMPKFKVMQKLIDRVNLVAREMLDGLMPIRAFGRQAHELQRFDDASQKLMGTQLFTNRTMAFMMPIMMFVMNCVTVLIVWFGSHGVSDGVMQVGDMMAFMSYTMQIVMAFMILTMVAVMLPRAAVAADRVYEVLECPLSIMDPDSPQTPAATAPQGELAFNDVSFRYPDADEDVISHVSFITHAGKTTALIGSTGSGKSTVVQLIPRLYDATEGSVTLDGVDVRQMALADLRGRIGYVPQQGMLFSGTIASNIAYGKDDISDEDVREAARVAQAAGFIAEKDDGYDSPIAQRGSNVSGGQRQRLAIARALATHPEVLVFDDSFSALDYATDARLRAELARSVKDAAVVMVAQRIATIMHADEILVLDDGQVVGRGTHEELLRSCPTYREIAESQLSAKELGLEDTDDADPAAAPDAPAADPETATPAQPDTTPEGGER